VQNAAPAAPAALSQPAVLAAAQQAAAALTQNFSARPALPGLGGVPALPGLPGMPGLPGPAAAKPKTFRPAPLRLDEQGREIDEQGRVVSRAVEPRHASTLKARRRRCDHTAASQHFPRCVLKASCACACGSAASCGQALDLLTGSIRKP